MQFNYPWWYARFLRMVLITLYIFLSKINQSMGKFIGVVKLHDMPFSETRCDPYSWKTNLMFVQYVEMMTKNKYPCRLQANAQWHTSYFTYQYSRKYYPGWDTSIAENKRRIIIFHKKLKTKCICIPTCRTCNWLWSVYLNRPIKLLVNAHENIHLERWQHRLF